MDLVDIEYVVGSLCEPENVMCDTSIDNGDEDKMLEKKPSSANFISHSFLLTLEAIHLGLIPVIRLYEKIQRGIYDSNANPQFLKERLYSLKFAIEMYLFDENFFLPHISAFIHFLFVFLTTSNKGNTGRDMVNEGGPFNMWRCIPESVIFNCEEVLLLYFKISSQARSVPDKAIPEATPLKNFIPLVRSPSFGRMLAWGVLGNSTSPSSSSFCMTTIRNPYLIARLIEVKEPPTNINYTELRCTYKYANLRIWVTQM